MEKASALSPSSVAGFCFAAEICFTLVRMDECTILHMRHGRSTLIMRAQPTTIEPVQYVGRIPGSRLQEPSCKRGYFVHVGFGSHTQLRACGGTCKWRLRPWAEPASARMERHVQVAISGMGGTFKDPACASIWAEPANLTQLF